MSAGGWYVVDKKNHGQCFSSQLVAESLAEHWNKNHPIDAPHRAVQLVELTPQLAAAGEVLEALKLAKAMFIANDMSLPHTMAIIDAAIAKAEGQKGGAL